MSWLLWLRVVLVTVLLIPFVQLSTRLWAQKARPAGRQLRIRESLSLGGESRLHLLEVAGRVYLLSTGPQGAQVVDQLPPEVLTALEAGEGVRGEEMLWGGGLLEEMLGPKLAAGVRRGLEAAKRAVGALKSPGRARRSGTGEAEGQGNPAVAALERQLVRVKRLEMGAR